MALGFVKRIFSFGKKKVEEVPAEGETPAAETSSTEETTAPAAPARQPPAAPEAPAAPDEKAEEKDADFKAPTVPEFLRRPDAEKTPSRPDEPEPVADTPEPEEETEPAPEQPQEPVELDEPAVDTVLPPEPVDEPVTVSEEKPAEQPASFEPLTTAREDTAEEQPSEPPIEAAGEPQEQPPERETEEPREAETPSTDKEPGGEPAPAPSPAPPAARISVGRTVERRAETAPEPVAAPERKPWFQRLREGLSRSSRELSGSISGIFLKRKLDEDTLQDLEDVLLRADLGLETAMHITDSLAAGRYGKDISDAEVRAVMAEEIEKVLAPVARPLELDLSHKPHVILVVGVNGTGKTTTIGKLAAKLRQGGLSVMLAAGDTFRAAAIEQLKIWGERTGSPVVASKLGADAAGLAWDAYEKAKAEGCDVLIIDTAGRLQNKAELMAELEKIVRVLGKHDPEAPHTVLQTVDATTGQNALNQVEIFRNVAGVNGLVMTKLDGTARGGILVAIAAKHKLPVYFIGVGEQVEDLEPFSAGDFAKAIAGVE